METEETASQDNYANQPAPNYPEEVEGELVHYDQQATADNELDLERHLECIKYWRRKAEEYGQHGQKMILKAKLWTSDQERKCANREAWHKYAISYYLHARSKTKLNLVNGNACITQGKEKIIIKDNQLDHFFAVAPRSCFTVKMSPDKDAILKHLQTTGEILPGVEVVRGDEVLRITLKE